MTIVGSDNLVAGADNDGVVLEEFTSGGALNTSFGTDGVVSDLSIDSFTADSMEVLSDGNILVAGGNGIYAMMAELDSDGSLDTSFGSGGLVVTEASEYWHSITMLSGGGILAVGISGDDNGEIVLGEFNSDGSANTDFGSGGITDFDAYNISLAVTLGAPDGEITIGALADPDGEALILAKFTSAGELDTSYGDGGSYIYGLLATGDSTAIALDGSGGVLVIGSTHVTGLSGYKLYIADVTDLGL
jgi:uncharacterized delta-60 repeat protein